MAKILQFRRDTTSGISTITGAEGELFVDLTKDTLVVMDGTTQGGQALQKELVENSNITAGIITATTFSGSGASLTSIPNSATTATNANTNSTIVARDGSGNFSAGTITANLTGTASNVTTNANLTGHVTSVGNAAVLGSFTSANLATALTDETGSGANVFATSPTLVTPLLGTPTSGNLANCTFPTLNQSTTGNAATATALQTARTIGGVSFNGSANINLPGVNTAGNQNTSGSAATLTTGRTIAITGDLSYTSASFNGSGNVTAVGTLSTVNSNVGSFGGTGTGTTITVNAKGLITGITTFAASSGGTTITDDTSTNATTFPLFSDVSSGTPTATYASSSKLNFNPSTGTLSATQFTSLSDRTQKTNIRPIENATNLVSQMNGVYYDWVDGHNTGSVGVIAQDIEKVLPEVVTINNDGLKSVSYGNIVGVLIEAIKEQQIRIEKLENKLNVQ